MRVVISAAGTGGHIYPALAIIKKIKKMDKNSEFLYIGTTNRMEKDIVPKEKIPYYGVEIYGLKRSLSFSNFKSLFKFLTSIKKVKKKIKEFNPDIVIGTGGYVTAPVIYSAKRLGIKTLIHEQNSILGLTNKMLLKYTDTLCTSFESMKIDKVNCVYTGNPISNEAKSKKPYTKKELNLIENKKIVLIVMGSLGSSTINSVLIDSISEFNKKDYQVVIVSGKNQKHAFDKVKKGKNVFVFEYIDDLSRLMKITDVMVTRAGASTLSEIVALSVPSILVPSPYVAENHQFKNANDLCKKEAALLTLEKDFNTKKLINDIDILINDKEKVKKMKSNLTSLQINDSLDRIYLEIEKLVKE